MLLMLSICKWGRVKAFCAAPECGSQLLASGGMGENAHCFFFISICSELFVLISVCMLGVG